MARQQGIKVESKFIRGLITETTPLSFPTDACTATWNCVFDEKGQVTRRKGIDLENPYAFSGVTHQGGDAHVEFIWDQVGTNSNTSFLVQQVGYFIHFFDISDNTKPSSNKTSFTINLSNYTDANVITNVRISPCDFTQGSGRLYIANRYHAPLRVEYRPQDATIDITPITLYYRDTKGIEDDGWELNERKTMSSPTMMKTEPLHAYNLFNQGWWAANILANWDTETTARSDMPSNADAPSYFRASATDPYNPTYVNNNSHGNMPAPRGHFILEVGREDRMNALTQLITQVETIFEYPHYLLDLTGNNSYINQIDQADGVIIHDSLTNSSLAFDADDVKISSDPHTNKAGEGDVYIGKDWDTTTDGTKVVSAATVYTLEDAFPGFWGIGSGVVDAVVELFGSNTAPANPSDGTLLGTADAPSADVSSFVGVYAGLNTRLIYQVRCDDWTTSYRYHWVRITRASGTSTFRIAQVKFFSPTIERQYPSKIAWFNGRLFYAGFTEPDLANKVFFTQIIERYEQEGQCYQSNDPASEFIPDLVDSDGGVLQIRNMNEVQKIIPYQDQLIVLARNATFIVRGTNGAFAATGYGIREVSGIGTSSSLSVVSVKGTPIWWGEDGIYTVEFDPNYSSVTLKSLTESTIKSFITDLKPKNRKYVKGTYDRLENVVYWVYNNAASLSSIETYSYNKCLCFNVISGAFYPWELNVTDQKIRGVVYVQDGARETDTFAIKFPVMRGTQLSYAEPRNTSHKDWVNYAVYTTDSDDELDFLSYFISGYSIDGKLMTNFQGNYVSPIMLREANASVLVQGLYDFTDSSNSGKWSTAQQGYQSDTDYGQTHKEVKQRRLKIRGHGKALQIKMYSETGKPFTLLGWAMYATGNSSI